MQRDSAENERRRIEGDYKYVRHEDIADYERRGWVRLSILEGTHHGDYSAAMKYNGEVNMNLGAYENIPAFERELAQYTGAPYVAVIDSCTNALFLCCKYLNVKEVSLPRFTYHSVPMAVINAGGRVVWDDRKWLGSYSLNPYPIRDSARRFTSGMYGGGFECVSFHTSKILGDSQGGAILHSNREAQEWFEEMRFDGRKPGTTAKNWIPRVIGFHCRMWPGTAANLRANLAYLPKHNPDLPNDEYADLSTWEIFK